MFIMEQLAGGSLVNKCHQDVRTPVHVSTSIKWPPQCYVRVEIKDHKTGELGHIIGGN